MEKNTGGATTGNSIIDESFDHNNSVNNSNGNLNNNNSSTTFDMTEITEINKQQKNDGDLSNGGDGGGEPDSLAECLDLFKACCKKKPNFGLEDLFWISLLLIIIIFSILKGVTRYTWSQLTSMMFCSIAILILLYIGAAIFNKFVLEDSSTAHWNAHARYTQAAIQSRLKEEEQRIHVIAPPKMGGAKLNIIYSVGDVPLIGGGAGGKGTTTSSSISTINNSRHDSTSSGGGLQNNAALCNLTAQAINTAAALVISGTGGGQPPSSPKSKSSPKIIKNSSSNNNNNSNTTSSITTTSSTTISTTMGSLIHSKIYPITGSTGILPVSSSSLHDEIIAEEDDIRPDTPGNFDEEID